MATAESNTEILERGNIYFCYTPKVERHYMRRRATRADAAKAFLETVVTSVGSKIQRRDLINSRHAPSTMRLYLDTQ